jgi:hypothetical protein
MGGEVKLSALSRLEILTNEEIWRVNLIDKPLLLSTFVPIKFLTGFDNEKLT